MRKRPSFFHHLHPATILATQARWRYTLGAGGLAVYLTITLLITGALEMFYYVATPESASLSIQTLTFLVPFGGLMRNMHYWAAQLLVVVSLIHFLRVIFTGAYAPPRRFNYLLGFGLFVLILMLDFSGYILRWDEGIRWALTVGTNLLNKVPILGDWLYRQVVGAGSPGPATLTRFYAAHIFTLTLVLVFVLGWHVFRVRRDGGISSPPVQPDSNIRISRYVLVQREVLAILIATIILLLLSAFVPAPLAPPLGSTNPTNLEANAPWFFLWIQMLLRYGSPFWLGVILPLGVLLFLCLIPFIFPAPPTEERGKWFPKGTRLVQIMVASLIIVILILTILDVMP
jgi:quinol-cytochrome oxidoreductase complex cytochrome b subunit